jgi:hypothetical protein
MRSSIRAAFIATLSISSGYAQTPPAAPPATQKSLAAALNVQVFPGGGQSSSQQSKDETECYDWSVKNTGYDPFAVAKQAEQQKQAAAQQQQQAAQSTQGAGARGAVRGAAAGAVVGEIANDDAGKGAAIGATAGVVAGRHRARQQQAQAADQSAKTQQAASQTAAQQTDAFNKGFAACLEAKKYTVKF